MPSAVSALRQLGLASGAAARPQHWRERRGPAELRVLARVARRFPVCSECLRVDGSLSGSRPPEAACLRPSPGPTQPPRLPPGEQRSSREDSGPCLQSTSLCGAVWRSPFSGRQSSEMQPLCRLGSWSRRQILPQRLTGDHRWSVLALVWDPAPVPGGKMPRPVRQQPSSPGTSSEVAVLD